MSFVLLGGLWRRPLLEAHSGGRRPPRGLESALLSRALRVLLGGDLGRPPCSTPASALFGTTIALLNFAPTFVYVVFFRSRCSRCCSATSGACSARGARWRTSRCGPSSGRARGGADPDVLRAIRPLSGSGRALRLRLARARASPWERALARSPFDRALQLLGSPKWRCSGATRGHGAAKALRSRSPARSRRSRRATARSWCAGPHGLAGSSVVPGTLLFLAVMISSTSFDGFSQTSSWTNLLADVRSRLADESLRVVDLATTLTNVAGLAFFVLLVVVTYFAAIAVAQRLVRAPRSLTSDFLLALVPIAFAYVLAHYFSYFLIRGRSAIQLIHGPVGPGLDPSGTADFAPNLATLPLQTVVRRGASRSPPGTWPGLRSRTTALWPCSRPAHRLRFPVPDAGADGAVYGGWPAGARELIAHGGLAESDGRGARPPGRGRRAPRRPAARAGRRRREPACRARRASGTTTRAGRRHDEPAYRRRAAAARSGARAPTPRLPSALPTAATPTLMRMSAFPEGTSAERCERHHDHRERPQRVPGDREDAGGPELEHVLRLGDLRSRTARSSSGAARATPTATPT